MSLLRILLHEAKQNFETFVYKNVLKILTTFQASKDFFPRAPQNEKWYVESEANVTSGGEGLLSI